MVGATEEMVRRETNGESKHKSAEDEQSAQEVHVVVPELDGERVSLRVWVTRCLVALLSRFGEAYMIHILSRYVLSPYHDFLLVIYTCACKCCDRQSVYAVQSLS